MTQHSIEGIDGVTLNFFTNTLAKKLCTRGFGDSDKSTATYLAKGLKTRVTPPPPSAPPPAPSPPPAPPPTYEQIDEEALLTMDLVDDDEDFMCFHLDQNGGAADGDAATAPGDA